MRAAGVGVEQHIKYFHVIYKEKYYVLFSYQCM